MRSSAEWEIKRHRVALCGRVVHRNGQPAGGARVTITEAPKKFKSRMHAAAAVPLRKDELRPNVTMARPDGIFCFLDLPEGEYTVIAEGLRAGERAQNHGKVVWTKDGGMRIAVVDLQLLSS